jgi:uncharacterized protein YraI
MRPLLTIVALLAITARTPLLAQQEVVQVNTDNVRLRATAAIDGSIVATLPKGAKLTVIGHTGAWVQVRYGERSGFVRASLVSGTGTAASSAPRAATTPPSPPPAPPRETPRPAAPTPPAAAEPESRLSLELRQGKKDPAIATLISVLIAGGGQIYAGEVNRGIMMLLAGPGAITLGVVGYSATGSAAPIYLGLLVATGSWIYSIVDAGPAAHRTNVKNGYRTGLKPIPMIHVADNGKTYFGVHLSF